MLKMKRPSLSEELKKNPEMKESDIQMLREWMKKQHHLPQWLPDEDLILFYHSNYFQMEPTKKTIDAFCTIRTHVFEIFHNRDPLGNKGIRQFFNVGSNVLLPGRTKENYHILYGTLIDPDASNFVFFDCLKTFCMMTDIWVAGLGTAPGYAYVGDATNMTLGHVGRVNLIGAKKFLTYIQEAAPVRLKAIHVINAPAAMDVLLNMVKPFMKKELIDLIHIHTSLDSLNKHVPVEYLPNEAGGKAGPHKDFHATEIRRLEDNRDFFLDLETKPRVDESLRPKNTKSASELFGVEGTFKKLELD